MRLETLVVPDGRAREVRGTCVIAALNEDLRAAMQRRPAWDALLLVRGAAPDPHARDALLARAAREDLGVVEAPEPQLTLVGGACLEAIGLLDEHFDDELDLALADLAHRAQLAGFFVSAARSIGLARGTVRATTKRTAAWLDARAHYLTKHHGTAYRRVADVTLALGGAWAVARERARGIRSEESRRWLRALLRQAASRGR